MKSLESVCTIYVFTNEHLGLHKVGITSDIKQRLSVITNSSGVQIKLNYRTIPMPRAIAQEIEKKIHTNLKEFRTFGEWFKVDLKEILSTIRVFDRDMIPSEDYKLLMSGKTVTEIANIYGVSTAAISKRFALLGVSPNGKQDFELNTKGKFNRISENIYSNGYCFQVKKYVGGKLYEEFFATKEEALTYLMEIKKTLDQDSAPRS